MTIIDKQIRDYLGHNGAECRVTIKRDGSVHRFGSDDAFDRSQDGWHYMGTRDEIIREIEQSGDAEAL